MSMMATSSSFNSNVSVEGFFVEPILIFADKVKIRSKITLIEKLKIKKKDKEKVITEKVISNDSDISEMLNKFFANIVKNWNIALI